MTDAARSGRPRIVVVGAGVAALEFVLALGELAPDRATVELVAPDVTFDYSPFAVARTFAAGSAFEPALDRVASHTGVQQRHGRIVSVDPLAHVVFTATGEAVPYDLLVVASGA